MAPIRIAVVLVGVALLALAVRPFITDSSVSSSQARPGPGGSGPTSSPKPKAPTRPPFFFRIQTQAPAIPGKRGGGAPADASIEIAARLSSFYDTVFMDPTTWANGVPDSAWRIFTPSVADRARDDAQAFTLGGGATDLVKLTVTKSSLTVRILLDPAGNPDAAVAETVFIATGTLVNGGEVKVTNRASFLLRLERGQWVVFGYPNASTEVQAVPVPSSATPTGPAGGTPTPTGTPTP